MTGNHERDERFSRLVDSNEPTATMDAAEQNEVALVRAMRDALQKNAARVRTEMPANLHSRISQAIAAEARKVASEQAAPAGTVAKSTKSWWRRPALVIPALATVICVVAIGVFQNRTERPKMPTLFELSSASYANFSAIVRGNLKVAHATADTADLQAFFRSEGVQYAAFFPKIQATLVGGVVSAHEDKRYAHLVYAKDNHLVYIFQVDASSIADGRVALDQTIADDVKKSKWHWEERDNIGTLFVWESNSVMCSAVSDLRTQDMSALFSLETL